MIHMTKDQIEQITDRLASANHVLVVIPDGTNPDLVGSGLALQMFLKRLEKRASIVALGATHPKLGFLPGVSEIKDRIDTAKSFVIDVSSKRAEVAELSYQKTPDKLSIYLKPKSGEFETSDVSFRSSGFPYDLLIILGVESLDKLGSFYSNNTELFFETPIVNIDHKPANESYGQFNLVVLTATSVSEIMMDLLNKFEAGLMDAEIATLLLTGIISETNSFQHAKTTPQVFMKASQLVEQGARQQEIVSSLYKSKSLGLLKLWGRCLARLKTALNNLVVYSVLPQTDVEKAQATNEDISAIIKEMNSQLSFARVWLFLVEAGAEQTQAFCSTLLPISLADVFREYIPEIINPQTIKFSIPKNLNDAEAKTLELLNQQLKLINI